MIHECEWCYSEATMWAYTPRHDGIYLCGRHYRNVQHDMRAESLSRLSGVALDIVRAATVTA